MHSISYDDPSFFAGQTVLCIGGRASGVDVAREFVTTGGARNVYLSDFTCRTLEETGGANTKGK